MVLSTRSVSCAGLDAKQRPHQDNFLMEDVDIYLYYDSIGMGIKPDVRFIYSP
jgi:hypothetical protein